jgi:hypothetical protein
MTHFHGTQSTHPLGHRDREIVDRMASRTAETRTDQDVVDIARLLTRYSGFPGETQLRDDLIAAAKRLGYASRAEVNAAARAIWQAGFRPQDEDDGEVGSGADVQAAVE